MNSIHNVVATTEPPKRTKIEIVRGWEAYNPQFFRGLGPKCEDGCKCSFCFQQALDAMAEKSDAQLTLVEQLLEQGL